MILHQRVSTFEINKYLVPQKSCKESLYSFFEAIISITPRLLAIGSFEGNPESYPETEGHCPVYICLTCYLVPTPKG